MVVCVFVFGVVVHFVIDFVIVVALLNLMLVVVICIVVIFVFCCFNYRCLLLSLSFVMFVLLL